MKTQILLLIKCVVLAASVNSQTMKFEVLSGSKLPTPLGCHSVVYDGDDSIYIIGGITAINGSSVTDQDGVFKFSIMSGNVTRIGTFFGIRCGVAVLHGSDIVYIGGRSSMRGLSRHIYRYSTLSRAVTLVVENALPIPVERMSVAWDPVNQVAYIFGGLLTDPNIEGQRVIETDAVFRYNASTDKIEKLPSLPEPRAGSAAVWDNSSQNSYLFGGGHATLLLHDDILQYSYNNNDTDRPVSKLSVTLPLSVRYGTAFVGPNGKLYLVGCAGLTQFSPSPGKDTAEVVNVDNWPRGLYWSASVYVPSSKGVYIIAGWQTAQNGSDGPRARDEIGFISFDVPLPLPRWVIITGVAVGVALLAVLVFFLVRHFAWGILHCRAPVDPVEIKRFRRGHNEPAREKTVTSNIHSQGQLDDTVQHATEPPIGFADGTVTLIETKPYDERFEISRRKFIIDKSVPLGVGEFGKVYQGTLHETPPKKVAIKVPKRNCPEGIFTGLLKEVKIMTHLRHENVVSLVGANTARVAHGSIFIIMEFCEEGSIEQFLQHNKCYFSSSASCCEPGIGAGLMQLENRNFNYLQIFRFGFPDLIRWSKEIAAGMEFLSSKGVVHRDLASRNILLTSALKAKISDFGLSRQLYGSQAYIQRTLGQKLPFRWMAIECFSGQFSAQSDVWAYGILVWEIFSLGELPYRNVNIGESQQFVEILRSGVRISEMCYATPQIFSILKQCWHLLPDERPKFTELKTFFNSLLTQTTVIPGRETTCDKGTGTSC